MMKKLVMILGYWRGMKARQEVQKDLEEKKESVKLIWAAYRRYAHAEKMMPKLTKSIEENREKYAAIIAVTHSESLQKFHF